MTAEDYRKFTDPSTDQDRADRLAINHLKAQRTAYDAEIGPVRDYALGRILEILATWRSDYTGRLLVKP